MIPSRHILPSNAPPVNSDRVLRQASGNANFVQDDNYSEDDDCRDENGSSDDESVHEPTTSMSKSSRRFPGNGLSQDDAGRTTVRDARAQRHARNERLRALAQDPTSVFVAKYEDRLTKRKFERRECIAEAILPDEKVQWQHHLYEEQAKEQQRKRAYLDRERKELVKHGANAGQVVWPRHLDDAYQLAIRCVPPILGKKKMAIPDGHGGTKLAGRNELISRKIFQLTGQMRYRKQISSHNQVLRKFRVKNPHGRDVGTLEKSKDSRYVRIYDTKNLQWDDENGRLVYVNPNAQGSVKPATGLGGYDEGLSINTSAHLATTTSGHSVVVQSFDFAMNQYAPESEDRYFEVIEHQYTTLQSGTGARPQSLADVPNWRTMFPEADSLDKRDELQNCDIILVESSLAIGQPPRGKSRLSIKFNLDLLCPDSYREWGIRTTFCEDKGVPKYFLSNSIETCKRKEAGRTELIDVPFTSHWWRDLFSGIMKRRWEREQFEDRKIEEAGHGHCAEPCDMCQQLRQAARARLQQEDEHSNRYLEELGVTQELFAIDRQSFQGKLQRRVALFLWRFRRAWPGETATTIWRRLNHPNQPSSATSDGASLAAPQADSIATSQPSPLQKGSLSADIDCSGSGDHQLVAADHGLPYDLGASSYWDGGWIHPQLHTQHDTSDATGPQIPFSACPSDGSGIQYAHMDPSPSAQDSHDSGYMSQGTSYASQTPLLSGTQTNAATDNGNAYSFDTSGNDVSHGDYRYEDLQHLRNIGMSTFGSVDVRYEVAAESDMNAKMHSSEELSRLHAPADPNLYQLGNNAFPLGFEVGEHPSSSLGVESNRGAAHPAAPTTKQHGPPAADAAATAGELHAPQPLHPTAAPAGSLLGGADAGLQPFGIHSASSLSTLFPANHYLPAPSQHPPRNSPHAEASMLLHLAQSNGNNGSNGSNPHGPEPSQGSAQHDGHHHHYPQQQQRQQQQRSGVDSPSRTGSHLWGNDGLSDFPSGLFLDVDSTLGYGSSGDASGPATGPTTYQTSAPNGPSNLFDASHERAQEAGRILGSLLDTASTAVGQQRATAAAGTAVSASDGSDHHHLRHQLLQHQLLPRGAGEGGFAAPWMHRTEVPSSDSDRRSLGLGQALSLGRSLGSGLGLDSHGQGGSHAQHSLLGSKPNSAGGGSGSGSGADEEWRMRRMVGV